MSGDDSADGGSVVLRFVLPRGKNEATCTEELSEAFEKCEDNDMKPAWIGCDDALGLKPTKTVGWWGSGSITKVACVGTHFQFVKTPQMTLLLLEKR